MRTLLLTACLILGAGSAWMAVAERKEIRLDNNRFAPSIITARVSDTLSFVNGRGRAA